MSKTALQRGSELQNKQTLYNSLVDQFVTDFLNQQHQQQYQQTFTNTNNHLKNNQRQQKQSTINNKYINKSRTNKLRQLFDLLVYFNKKQPQILQTVIEIGLIEKIVVNLTNEEIFVNVKSFILLIANCSTQGPIMTYFIKNRLIDLILVKYLESLRSVQLSSIKSSHFNQQQQDQEGGIQYLASLLKAASMHINQKTYKYFCGKSAKNGKQDNNIFAFNQSNKSKDFSHKQKQQTFKNQSFNQQHSGKAKQIEDFFDVFTTHLNMQPVASLQNKQKFSRNQANVLFYNNVYLQKKSTNNENNAQCLLLRICTKFYNCPQELTRTTVINIVMRLLKEPFAKQLIADPFTKHYHSYIKEWGWNMCSVLKNQLKNFSQKLLVLQPQQLDLYIQELNDIIILWQDLTHTELVELYQQHFEKVVIDSLLVGSLNTCSFLMFNVNFTFYILAKLMNVMKNLRLVNRMGGLLFLKTAIVYEEKWITTAMLKGFEIKTILYDDQNDSRIQNNNIRRRASYQQQTETEKLVFEGVNEFFLSMLKSKDQNFLFIACNLLYHLIVSLRQQQQQQKQNLLTTYGLNSNGNLLTKISSILINQLRHDHPLNSLKLILQIIIFIHPTQKFNEENSNDFVFFYKEVLTQTLQIMESSQLLYHNYIVEIFQYDIKWLEASVFKSKGWRDQQILKHYVQHQEEGQHKIMITNSKQQKQKHSSQHHPKRVFSLIIPQTPSQTLRYKIIKTFLLLKFNQIMIENKKTHHILTNYVEKLRLWEEKQPKPGDKIPYPIKQKFHQCKLIEQKTEIPWFEAQQSKTTSTQQLVSLRPISSRQSSTQS